MKFYLSALEDLFIECDILVCIFDSLLNQLNSNNFLAANLAQTQSNRTRSTTNVHQGRLFINLKKTLGAVARDTLFEQNNASTRARFVATCERILQRIQALEGISQYKVICDESNNPITVVEQNQFFAEVLIKPLTSINFITITLTNVDLETDIS